MGIDRTFLGKVCLGLLKLSISPEYMSPQYISSGNTVFLLTKLKLFNELLRFFFYLQNQIKCNIVGLGYYLAEPVSHFVFLLSRCFNSLALLVDHAIRFNLTF